ncbi:hypothetical protein BDR04DRAFT_1226196 [Suillus decipiens]|nr:hypothetical protein BDR04DRAFT_1226196 [Suillus decipiens]
MPSTRLESVSDKENINPTECQGKQSYKKTKAFPFAVMPTSAKAKDSRSASTPSLAKQHAVCDQHSLSTLAYSVFAALDDSLFSHSADSRAKELTESPLAEVTDAFDDPYASTLIDIYYL